ncbi:MAG: hypothetical protein RJB64_1247, partial [Pseudomonadota bacterium]
EQAADQGLEKRPQQFQQHDLRLP